MFSKYFSSTLVILLFSLLIFASCGSDPEPINYGVDECEFCRMLITDNKYGAELVTDKGKIYKFDSIECLVDFTLAKNLTGDQTQTLLITDFSSPGNFVDARSAYYVRNNEFRSPMGLNVMAFGENTLMLKFVSENGGDVLSWVELIEIVKQRSV